MTALDAVTIGPQSSQRREEAARTVRAATQQMVSQHGVSEMKRIYLPATAIAAVALWTLALAGGAALRAGEHEHGEHFAKCAKACADCQLKCDACFHHCAHMLGHGKKEHAKSMHLCVDCGTVCATAAQLSARHSPVAGAVCDACAKVCDVCAAECEKFKDDKHMTECAKSCRDCAKECRAMVKHTKH